MDNNWTFEQWMKLVDRWVARLCGMSFADLPDAPYADWYERGTTPMRAAKRAIRMAGSEC